MPQTGNCQKWDPLHVSPILDFILQAAHARAPRSNGSRDKVKTAPSAYHHPLHGAPDNEGRDPSGSGHRAPAPYQHWEHEGQRRALLEFPVRSGAKRVSDRDGFRGLSTTPPLPRSPKAQRLLTSLQSASLESSEKSPSQESRRAQDKHVWKRHAGDARSPGKQRRKRPIYDPYWPNSHRFLLAQTSGQCSFFSARGCLAKHSWKPWELRLGGWEKVARDS